MSKHGFLLIIVAFIGLGLLVSCKPVCSPETLVAPTAINPTAWELVDSLTPTFAWEYPDTTCLPEGYRIEIYQAPAYDEFMTGGATGGTSTAWAPASDLLPHSVYYWKVLPIVGTTLGPASYPHRFVTGPVCDTSTLNPPIIVSPEDMEIITTDPFYVWLQEPDLCLPEGHDVQASQDPTFSDIETYESTIPALAWIFGDLEDCSTYYIRSVANNGPIFSDYSDSTTVFTNLAGLCPTPPMEAAVSGTVWNDECSIGPTGPLPATLPDGCVDNGSGGAWADAYQQPSEHGIRDVQVMIGKGYCPSCGLGTAMTDNQGEYFFPGLQAGGYCLCIKAEDNDSIPLPGMWTLVMSGHEDWTYRHFFLTEGQNLTGQDFAWFHFPSETKSLSYSKFSFYCADQPLMFMADFSFDDPPKDTFELRFAEVVYPCSIDQYDPNLLHCFGSRIEQNRPVVLNLWDFQEQKNIATIETKTPDCTIENITEDCSRFNENECDQHKDVCYWTREPNKGFICKNR